MPPIPAMSLSDLIKNSSGNFVKNEVAKLASKNHNFFHSLNRKWFFKDAPELAKDFANNSSGTSIPKNGNSQIAQYIGLSTLVHCIDGWVYFSRAINSLIRGDIPSAIHLIYYSELRAVMSLLATNGIGVFNKVHIAFDASGNIFCHRLHTHSFVAKCLDEIVKNTDFMAEIFKDINVLGTSLDSVITSTGYNSTSFANGSLASNLFESWSVDISLSEDHNLRNESSYRPMYKRYDVTTEMLEKILDLWEALEPFGSSFFYKIDIAIIMATLKKIANATNQKYLNLVQKIDGVILDPRSTRILSVNNHKELWLLNTANRDKGKRMRNFKDPFPMICRALFLNRLATGQTRCFLPTVMSTQLDDWMQRIMIKFRILDPKLIPDSMDYLYQDVTDAIAEVKAGIIVGCTEFELLNLNHANFHTLTQFERVPLWGFQ